MCVALTEAAYASTMQQRPAVVPLNRLRSVGVIWADPHQLAGCVLKPGVEGVEIPSMTLDGQWTVLSLTQSTAKLSMGSEAIAIVARRVFQGIAGGSRGTYMSSCPGSRHEISVVCHVSERG
jgi:hypothetical protein